MGVDYAMATLPYAVRNINEMGLSREVHKQLDEFMDQIGEDFADYEGKPFYLAGWEVNKDSERIGDSKGIRKAWAYKTIKDDKAVYIIEEGAGSYGGDEYYSVGAYDRAALVAFMVDLGESSPDIIENYVFFRIW